MHCLDFHDRSVMVVGAGVGIGETIARSFGEAGAHLALTHLPGETGAQEVAEAMRREGREALVEVVDSRDLTRVRRFVDTSFDVLGGLDVLVYNAGLTDPHPVLELTEEDWDRTMDINLRGMFFCCQQAARRLRDTRRSSSMILLSSVQGMAAGRDHVHYSSSKAAINHLTRVLAVELGPEIRVNAIAPGAIYTERIRRENQYDPAEMADYIPLHRVGLPEDVAHAALFLASEYASYITGHVLVVDGGMLAPLRLPGKAAGERREG